MKLAITAILALAGVMASAQSWDRNRDGNRGPQPPVQRDWDRHRDRDWNRDRDRDRGRWDNDSRERQRILNRIEDLERDIRRIRADRRLSWREKSWRIEAKERDIRQLRARLRWDRH
jgi:Ni/Co efflux regulator RcnB